MNNYEPVHYFIMDKIVTCLIYLNIVLLLFGVIYWCVTADRLVNSFKALMP